MATADVLTSPTPLPSDQQVLSAIKMMPHEPSGDTMLMDPPSQHVTCEWMSTSLRLPRVVNISNTAQDGEDVYLCLPVHVSEASYFKSNEEKEEHKDDSFCVTTATDLRLIQLQKYLTNVPQLAMSTERLLLGGCIQSRRSKYDRQFQLKMPQQSPPQHRLITSTNSGRVINVLQGEIAHCTPSQADVLVSDDATTCHIVGLWSRYIAEGGDIVEITNRNSTSVLATMTHIDGPRYERCIRDAVNEHIKLHSMQSKQGAMSNGATNAGNGVIEMTIHMMGGFNDDDDSSIEITDSILQTLAAVSDECNSYAIIGGLPHVSMILETCAVSCANDNGTGCPIGRGLAMEVNSGNVFLAEVEDVDASVSSNQGDILQLMNNISSAQGPEVTLRSVRLWASAFHRRVRRQDGRLNVIHRPNNDYLCIEPFFFGPHSNVQGLLDCTDEELLKITSTSPEVEKSNFASKVRESLTYMNRNKSSIVFPAMGKQQLKYRRVGLNGWVRSD